MRGYAFVRLVGVATAPFAASVDVPAGCNTANLWLADKCGGGVAGRRASTRIRGVWAVQYVTSPPYTHTRGATPGLPGMAALSDGRNQMGTSC